MDDSKNNLSEVAMIDKSFVLEVVEITDKEWIDFVLLNPSATIFHHPSWAITISETYQHKSFAAVAKDPHGQIIGGIPIIEIDSWLTGKRWISLAFTDHCKPILKDECSIEDFTNAVLRLWERTKIPNLELRFGVHNLKKDVYSRSFYIHHLKLDKNEMELYRSFRKKGVQYCIKKGLQAGVNVSQRKDFDSLMTFYDLHSLTRRKLGVPVQPKKFFIRLWENLIRQDLGFIMLASYRSQPVAGGVFLSCNNNLVYKYGASDPEYTSVYGTHVLLWEMIRWACQSGFEVIDWGRTDKDNEGLRNFKQGWGTQEEDLTYVYIGKSSIDYSNGSIKGVMSKVIHKSPLWVGRTIGELLYRHMG